MKKAILERSGLAKVSGRRNMQSLNEADENEQRSLSRVNSRTNNQEKQKSANSSVSSAMNFSSAESRKFLLKLQCHIQHQQQHFARNHPTKMAMSCFGQSFGH